MVRKMVFYGEKWCSASNWSSICLEAVSWRPVGNGFTTLDDDFLGQKSNCHPCKPIQAEASISCNLMKARAHVRRILVRLTEDSSSRFPSFSTGRELDVNLWNRLFFCVLQISCSFSFVLGLRLGLEQAGNPFCLLINSSWLLVFISLFYLLLMGLNLYWWKGIHFS